MGSISYCRPAAPADDFMSVARNCDNRESFRAASRGIVPTPTAVPDGTQFPSSILGRDVQKSVVLTSTARAERTLPPSYFSLAFCCTAFKP